MTNRHGETGRGRRLFRTPRLAAKGLPDAQIAERLYLSPYTVKAHLRSIYNKPGVTLHRAATRFAVEQGIA